MCMRLYTGELTRYTVATQAGTPPVTDGNGAARRSVTLLAAADIGTVPEPQAPYAESVAPVLAAADIRFAQCERSFSRRGTPPGWGRNGTGEGEGDHTRLDPRLAEIWRTLNIDVASLASNHTRDWGPDALLDTIDCLESMGIATIGAGADDAAARRPALIERNGVRIAFLAYVSVMRNGEQAGTGRPGLAPMRARTYYEPIDYQPGCPPRILTIPYDEDLRALERDVAAARQVADVVVVSLHWGVHFLPKVIAGYQPIVAHAAIDAGADLLLGHHSHLLNAIEVYRGRVCFYGMGNFMASGKGKGRMPSDYYNLYWYPPDPDAQADGRYPFPRDSRHALLVKASLTSSGVERVAFLPLWIEGDARPVVLDPDDERFGRVVDYVRWTSDQFPTRFVMDGAEVVVATEGDAS